MRIQNIFKTTQDFLLASSIGSWFLKSPDVTIDTRYRSVFISEVKLLICDKRFALKKYNLHIINMFKKRN